MRFDEISINSRVEMAVLFASYEARCVEVARALAKSGYHGEVRVYFCQDLLCDATRRNLATIESAFGRSVMAVPVSYVDPLPMVRSTTETQWSRSVLIDVTCFNRGNLFPFLWASGLGIRSYPEVTFAYTAPREYGTWLSREYEPPTNLLGFPGSSVFAEDRVLICLVGFETDRALSVIRAVEPSRVILTVGTIPTRAEFVARNRHAVEQVHGSAQYEIREIDVSHPGRSLTGLMEITDKIPSESAVHCAPFSTKLSCLGLWGLWLARHQMVRVWNAQPRMYNLRDYSKGGTSPRYFRLEW